MTDPTAGGAPDAVVTSAGAVRRTLHTPEGRVGVGLVVAVVIVAIVGPFVAPHDVDDFVGRPFSATSAAAPLGTDNLGRDVLSRFLDGGRVVLVLAIVATLLGVGLGTTVGLVAGSARRWGGTALIASTDLLLVFPQIVLALLFVSLLGPRTWLLVVVVALVHIPRTARVIRSATADVVRCDYVDAARALGVPRRQVLVREVLPNVTSPLVVELGLGLAFSVALLGALSFLGFGVQPPLADWGLMIQENQIGLSLQPLGVLAPTLAIALFTIGVNLFTDGYARCTGMSIIAGDLA